MRNYMRRIYLAVLLSVFVGIAVRGQDTTLLTFQDAMKIALMNGVTLNQQKNLLEVSQLGKISGIASLGPSVFLNGRATQFNGNSFNTQQGRAINGIRDNVSGSIDGNLTLFNGFSKINTMRQYANLLDAQSYFVNRSAQDVINTVSLQYLQVLLDEELLRISKENFTVLQKQLDQIREFVKVGTKSPVDEYNQDALTRGAELLYIQAEVNLNNDKALLIQTLQIDPFDPFNVQKPAWDINSIAMENSEPTSLVEIAKQHRGDYLQAAKLELAQKYGTRAARSNIYPSLGVFGSYGSAYNFQHGVVMDSSAIASGINRPFENQFRLDNVYKSYGLQLSIPVFNGLQGRYFHAQQRALYRNSQLTAKNAEIQLKNDVLRTIRNFDSIKKSYTISVAQLKAAEIAFQYETERYNLEVTSLVDYITANRTYIKAQTDMAQAEYRLLFQKIQLQYSLGTLKIEDLQ